MKISIQLRCLLVLLALTMTLFAAWGSEAISQKPNAADAEKFIERAEKRYLDATIKDSRASWVQSNFITDDTELIAADAKERLIVTIKELADESRQFDGLQLSPDVTRKIKLLKLAVPLPAPSDPAEREELTRITVRMESEYGKFEYCPEQTADAPAKPGQKGRAAEAQKKCLSLGDLETIMAESRNPEELKKAWAGWHKVSPQYRKDYARFVELTNKGAREMGFKDAGAMWRSNYDMDPDQFAAEMERLWLQVKPLYDSLHTYVRAKLRLKYGEAVPATGPIPAQLLGNMWSQSWGNIYDLVKPATAAPTYDLTKILVAKKTDAKQMTRYGEGFFTSLGFDQLPQSFWDRSLFTKPQDRAVVCHASAWDIDSQKDVRLKMCIKINEEDFQTIHHELGHNYYQMAYAPQPPLYQYSANDGFHEAIGDAIALSVTPDYLKKIGLVTTVPPESADIALLMKLALDKVAFLPFGYLVDQWRWKVFSGEVGAGDYNKAWWELRQKYQNIAPPAQRSESDFDAGAKYHVAANVPYARYFLAHILQFQFQRAMCREAGYKGPLNRCSVYGNKQVGEKLKQMLAMGQSRPWPEALKALTGEEKMDATAILDYFAPLKKWLDEQNKSIAAK
ncbi:MAG TPA: M2 family metallopeptidase [Blastocatellia bacterium]|nr:M2 family metallopeptidase [Blastocatellia bacterium]